MSDQNQTAPVTICGLWMAEAKSGAKYMKGIQGRTAWLVFRNTHKDPDNPEHAKWPDYYLSVGKHVPNQAPVGEDKTDNGWG